MKYCSLLLRNGEHTLKKSGILSSRLDAEILLSSISGKDRLELISKENLKVSNEQALHFHHLIERRKKREPIAYIIKKKEFFSLPFFINSNSLIPRPETELLVEKILSIYKNKKPFILDVGTGSGCIILSLLDKMPNARGVGLEISKDTIKIAKINAKKVLKNHIFKVKFEHSSIQNFYSKKHFDVIISNPPYIPTYEIKNLSDDVQPVKPITYSVIKSGLIGLTKYISTYWSDRNVRCNALSPGGVFNNQPEEFVEKISELIPLGRMANKDEYRAAIQFLCSEASSYMNGHNLVMDGGRSVW